MLVRRLVLVLAVLLVLPAVASARPLRKGMRGHRVMKVQQRLHLPADGSFGPRTRRAVRRFQRKHGLGADGVVGPGTWAALGLRSAKTRHHRRRRPRRPQRSAHLRHPVRALQRALHVPADGVFGPGTAAAVRRFQRRHGLTADGVVGRATWAALGHRGVTQILRRRHARRPSRGRRPPPVVRRVIRAANRIARKPYRYGGGHARWRDTGYDCSGSVSYALHGAGLLASSMASGGFMTWGAPGRGRWITIYAKRSHMYMVIAGRRFDTSGQRESGTRWSRELRDPSGFTVRHPPGL